ncbi:MAG TPA: hypothetical protein VG407_03600 [Caulobacteraceae bacterium]|jgi:hypothetical protein|nr:hypothetical protein [Caulobacteraceae bacterium]
MDDLDDCSVFVLPLSEPEVKRGTPALRSEATLGYNLATRVGTGGESNV